jgi:PAS domain S-box-containing protein
MSVVKPPALESDHVAATHWFRMGLIAAAYFLSSKFGAALATAGSGNITLIWLPTGIAVAALFRWTPHYWPAVWLAAVLFNLSNGLSLPVALGVSVGNTLCAMVAAVLLRRWQFDWRFSHWRDVLVYAMVVFVSMTLSASGGVVALMVAGILPMAQASWAWLAWWMGDSVGAIVGGAVLISFDRQRIMRIWRRQRLQDRLFAGGGLVLLVVSGFLLGGDSVGRFFITAIAVLAVSWIAMQMGAWPAAFSVAMLAISAATALYFGRGPFVDYDAHQGFTKLWAFITAISITSLYLATLSGQRGAVERRLKVAEDKYRLIAENTSDGVLQIGANNEITYVSPAYLNQVGYLTEKGVQPTIESLYPVIHPMERDTLFASFYRAIEVKATERRFTYRIKVLTGGFSWREDSIKFLYNEEGAFTGANIISRDVTERKTVEFELAESRQHLREMTAKNEEQREMERKHIAREVHDELGQVLTALRMDISLLELRFGAFDPVFVSNVASMRSLADRALAGVRTVAENLRPVALNMGLHPAIEWLCHEAADRSSLDCTFETDGAVTELSEERSVVLFRIVQESLTNITRYANATQVQVALEYASHALKLTVQDDGIGFDVKAARQHKSFGLLGMHERALALGGQMDIVSAPGEGTCIQVTIPISTLLQGSPT